MTAKRAAKRVKAAIEFEERFGLGSYGCHELLHTVSVIRGLWEDSVENHAAARQFAKSIGIIGDAISDLYQEIGAVHLEALPDAEPRKRAKGKK